MMINNFKPIPIYEVPTDALLKEGNRILKNQYECIAFTTASHGFICVPERGVVDEQLCYDLGYKVYELLYHGGVIVAEKGDFGIAYFGRNGNTFKDDFMNYFVKWLKKKGIDAVIDNNDVLVDGCKCLGAGHKKHGVVDFSVIYIGVNPNVENIKKICNKPMIKEPKGLGAYGIDSEQIKKMFFDFYKKYYTMQLNIPLNIFDKKRFSV